MGYSRGVAVGHGSGHCAWRHPRRGPRGLPPFVRSASDRVGLRADRRVHRGDPARRAVPCIHPEARLLLLLLDACGGKDGRAPTEAAAAARTTHPLRRLSVQELRNTLPLVTGVTPTDALDGLPPDALDEGFDRIGDAQTVSLVHLEAFDALAEATARAMLAEGTFDTLTAACPDTILPPAEASVMSTLPATGFSGSPGWAMTVEKDHLYFLYSDSVTVTTTWAAPSAGRYAFRVPIVVQNTRQFPEVTLRLDGEVAATWAGEHGEQTLEAELTVAEAHAVAVQLDFAPGDVGWANLSLEIWSATVEGPVDTGATTYAAERAACADALLVELATRAWRRSPTEDETRRLAAVWAAGLAGGSASDAFQMLVQAILMSPHFLYLVEVGTEERPGWYRLTDEEQAARLSYALCEGPPDEALRAAAAAGALRTADQIEVQARRLLDAECGHATVARFHRQWLGLTGLDSLARDPAYYPTFTAGLGTAMREDTELFLDRMVYDERAGVAAIWASRQAWVGPDTAPLYGLVVTEPDTLVALPDDRAGPLTQPALLAATSKFSETSPVLRGVYVLENLLCQTLAPPPQDLDTTPPELDDSMTTRERWAAHSADPACAGCHAAIDPIGFALEGFDALGQARTEENGQPIDTTGAVPALDVASVRGGRELAEAIAVSPELAQCVARSWSRFALGHTEEVDADRAVLDTIAAAGAASVYEGLVELTRSEPFRYRIVAEEEE